SPRAVKQRDQQYMLGEFSQFGLGTQAVAAAFEVGKDAIHCLKLSEFGRGIINSLRPDSRTDLSRLESEFPELVKRFVRARDELDKPSPSASEYQLAEGGIKQSSNPRIYQN